MLGRLAKRIYGIGRNTYTRGVKLLVAHRIISGKAGSASASASASASVNRNHSSSRRRSGPRTYTRHNQTIPPRHTPQVKARFRQASRRV